MAVAARLSIDRLRADYRLPRTTALPHEHVRRTLDDLVRTRVTGELERAFAAREHESGVWLIERLEIDLALDLAAGSDVLAEAWARSIQAAFERALAADQAVYFPDQAVFLSRFLVDHAAGRAEGRWYYRAFDGLWALPRARALETAIVEDPERGRDALIALPDVERARVIAALGRTGATRVGRELSARIGPRRPDRTRVQRVLAAELAGGACTRIDAGGADAVLALYLAAVERDPQVEGPLLLELAEAVVSQAHRMASGLPAPTPLPRELALALAARRGQSAESAARRGLGVESAARRYTLSGGLFMLLALLDELPLPQACADLPGAPGGDTLALVRFLVLAKIAGPDSFVFGDPLWRELMGIAPSIDAPAVAGWLEMIDTRALVSFAEAFADCDPVGLEAVSLPDALPARPEVDRALGSATLELLGSFARRLPGFASSSPRYLFENFLDVRASLELDGDRRIVRLGRPPIHAVLAMTSLPRARFTVSWLPGRFELFGED